MLGQAPSRRRPRVRFHRRALPRSPTPVQAQLFHDNDGGLGVLTRDKLEEIFVKDPINPWGSVRGEEIHLE